VRASATFAFLVLAAAALPRSGATQALSVVGVVRDTAGTPIPLAEVTVANRKVLSDSLGRFFVAHALPDSVNIAVRRLGYESSTFTLSARDAQQNSVDVVLRRLATTLDAVNVEAMELRSKTALRGFDERKSKGMGTFVSREQIEARNTRNLTDVLRTERGVVVTRGVFRFSMHQAKRCTPMVFVDGQQAPGLNVDAVPPSDVVGVELYQSLSTTPSEFQRPGRNTECGTVVIWTKKPVLEVRSRSKP
jgi:hypothetical protein